MRSDIESKIRREFNADDIFAAIDAINEWDAARKGLLDDRLIRCALHLAHGSLAMLKGQIALGMNDYRDLIAAAEYKEGIRVHDFHQPFTKLHK